MQLHEYRAKLSAIRAFTTPARCPNCGDLMVAPIASEFIEGGEIRHHWECDTCGKPSSTSIPLISHGTQARQNTWNR
jgi:uncharacterized protein with PIN domain